MFIELSVCVGGGRGEGRIIHKDSRLPLCSTSISIHRAQRASGETHREEAIQSLSVGNTGLAPRVVVTVLKQVMSVTQLCWARLSLCHSANHSQSQGPSPQQHCGSPSREAAPGCPITCTHLVMTQHLLGTRQCGWDSRGEEGRGQWMEWGGGGV